MGDRLLADRAVRLPKDLGGPARMALAAVGFRSGGVHLQAAQDSHLPGSRAPEALAVVVHSAELLHLAAADSAAVVK
jgi:hypothetical protein